MTNCRNSISVIPAGWIPNDLSVVNTKVERWTFSSSSPHFSQLASTSLVSHFQICRNWFAEKIIMSIVVLPSAVEDKFVALAASQDPPAWRSVWWTGFLPSVLSFERTIHIFLVAAFVGFVFSTFCDYTYIYILHHEVHSSCIRSLLGFGLCLHCPGIHQHQDCRPDFVLERVS